MSKIVYPVSDRQVLTEDCYPRSGQYFIGIADVNESARHSKRNLRAHAFTFFLIAGVVLGILCAILLAILLDWAFWRMF